MRTSAIDSARRAILPNPGGRRRATLLALAALAALALFGSAGLWWRAQTGPRAPALAPRASVPAAELPSASTAAGATESPLAARRAAELASTAVVVALRVQPVVGAKTCILGAFRTQLDDLSDGTSRELAQREGRSATLTSGHRYRWTSLEPAFEAQAQTLVVPDETSDATMTLEVRALGPWRMRAIDARSGARLPRVDLRWEVRGLFDSMEYRAEVGRATLDTADGWMELAAAGFLARQSRVVLAAEGYREVATPWIDCDGREPVDWGDIGLWLSTDTDDSARTLRGRVLDADGRGCAGLRIAGLAPHVDGVDGVDLRVIGGQLWCPDRGQGLTALPFVESGVDGAFELPWPRDGASTSAEDASASAGEAPVESTRPVVWGRGHALRVFPTHLPGETARLVMPRGAALRGGVRVAEGFELSADACQVRVDVGGAVHALELDSQLRFEMSGLPAGPARVALSVLELQAGGERVVAESFAASVVLVDDQTADVELRWGVDASDRRVPGRLRLPSGVTFDSLRAALEVIGDDAPSRFASVAADGTFCLHAVPFERCRLFLGGQDATGSRGFAAAYDLDARSARPAGLDFELPGGRVVGRVRRAGQPVAGRAIVVEVEAGQDGGERVDLDYARALAEGLDLRSDAEGRFEVLGLRAGLHRFGAGGRRRVGCDVPAAGVVEVVLEIE